MTRPGTEEAPWDLVVVGAGIVGAWTAWLARQEDPDRRILLIDRGRVGGGATGWSAGLDISYGSDPLRRELTRESAADWKLAVTSLPGLPVTELPLVCVTRPERVVSVSERFVEPAPLRVESTDGGALRPWPDLRIAGDPALLSGAVCRRGHPAAVTLRLVEELAAAGVGCREGVEATGIEFTRGVLRIDTAGHGALAARRVVLAPGPWIARGPAAALADGDVRVKRVVALHLDVRPRPGQPVVFFLDDDAFLMPVPERGQTLFSFTSEQWDAEPDRIGCLSRRDVEEGIEVLRRHCPCLVDRAAGGRAFCDAYGPERAPLVRSDPGRPGLVLTGAGSGSGYRLAPALARRALALVAGAAPVTHATDATALAEEIR